LSRSGTPRYEGGRSSFNGYGLRGDVRRGGQQCRLKAHDFKPDAGVEVKQLGQFERRKNASLPFQLRP